MANDQNSAGQSGEGAGMETGETAGNVGGGGSDTRSTTDRAREAFNERVVDPARRAGEAMKESGQKMAEGGSQIGVRMIDQAETNAREAFAAMRAAAGAKDLSDVMRIQGDYLREQGSRSMSQAREIGELIMQFGRDAVAPMRGGGGSQR